MITNIDSLQFNIIYSSRKSIAIELKIDSIIVRAPKGMLRRDINAFLNEKRPWIEKNLAKIQERKNTLKQLPTFEAEEIRELTKKASIVIPEKVKKYAQIIGVDYGRIRIRKHMNHSARFYKEVEIVLPEYRKYKEWLKENGGLYIGRLP